AVCQKASGSPAVNPVPVNVTGAPTATCGYVDPSGAVSDPLPCAGSVVPGMPGCVVDAAGAPVSLTAYMPTTSRPAVCPWAVTAPVAAEGKEPSTENFPVLSATVPSIGVVLPSGVVAQSEINSPDVNPVPMNGVETFTATGVVVVCAAAVSDMQPTTS